MNRANQAALFQQTNLGLLSIRQSELNYYINLNIAFGTQAALIGGFTYGVFTQNQSNDDYDYADYFQDVYWVTSAGTIACAVHVIITTMSIQVLGPGLALHGPVGSMARAAEGMRLEQKPVIVSFILMMFLFSISTILSFWAVMSFYSALGGTIIFMIASRYWYYYCERIYLRFFWTDEESKWRHESMEETNPGVDDAPIPDASDNPIHEKFVERRISQKSSINGGVERNSDAFNVSDMYTGKMHERRHRNSDNGSETGRGSFGTGKNKEKKPSFMKSIRFPRFTSATSSKKKTRENSTSGRTNSVNANGTPDFLLPPEKRQHNNEEHSKNEIILEGYLLKKGSYATAVGNTTEPWERRYFIMNRSAHLYLYKNRQDFRSNPRQPIYLRPLDLHEYLIEIFNSEDPFTNRELSIETTSTLTAEKRSSGNISSGPKFQITLKPKESREEGTEYVRQDWVLRCDTQEELETWVSMIQDLVPENFV
jgi:hypothetical protein